MSPNKLKWLVFGATLGAYIPLIIGGWIHPADTNIACFCIWVILSATLTYAGWVQKYEGWPLQFGYLLGNIVAVGVAFIRGGYTFNVDTQGAIALYGFCGTVCVWAAVGYTTRRWNPDILYFGTIIVDVVSFYPVLKQFILPHESASMWYIVAWAMFGTCSFMNFAFVERLFMKIRADPLTYGMTFDEKKSYGRIFTVSAFSLENFVMIAVTVWFMAR